MNLSDLTSSQIAELDKENYIVIIPLGSVEQHGPHLPVGTKSYLAEAVAFEALKNLKADSIQTIIAPLVPFMPCQVNFGFTSNFSIGARTFSDALYEIGCCFQREGFKRIYFVNLSISPDAIKAIAVAIDDLNTLPDFHAYDPMPLWNFSPNETFNDSLKNLGLEPGNELHADVKETSAMLSIDPEFVDSNLIASLPPCKVNTSWEVLKGNFSFQEMGSDYGYLGTPSAATSDLGKLYIEEAGYGLSESIKFTLGGNQLPELPLQIRMLLKMVDLDEM